MLAFIAEQLALPPRVACGVGERTCQEGLAGRLHELGFDAVVEGAVSEPSIPSILALHGVAFLICLAAVGAAPLLSIAGAAVGVLSFWGELRGRPRLLRRLLLKQVTSNLVARHRKPGARARLLLVAHADVATSSAWFHPWAVKWMGARKPRSVLHPGAAVLVGGALSVFAAIAARDGLGPVGWGMWARALCIQLGLLAVAWDWWRSPPVPGAVDNASGLAVVDAVARELVANPLEHVEVWVIATGDREPEASGMEAFCQQFRHLLPPESTWVINVDDVGRGDLAVATAEGRWERLAYRPTLPALAEDLAATGAFGRIEEVELVGRTDAGPATEAGFRAVTLTALEGGRRSALLHTAADTLDAVQPATLEQARSFALGLARAVDGWVGRRPAGR